MGRPTKDQKWREAISKAVTKLTPDVVNKLKQAFSIGANDKQAYDYAEISKQTYYNWIKKYPELLDEFERMKTKLPLASKANIANAIQTLKDITTSKWLLERQETDDYGETLKIKGLETITEEDKKVLEEFHQKLKKNISDRSIKKAKEEGEL